MLLFHFCHLNRVSSNANAPRPQSMHEIIAIPLMKSALLSCTGCLQLGHLYLLSGVISATRYNPGHYPDFQAVFYVFLRILCLCSHLCFLYQGQSKSLLSCCVILITLFSEQIRQESPDCRNYSVFVIIFTIIACSCAFLYVPANLRLLIS